VQPWPVRVQIPLPHHPLSASSHSKVTESCPGQAMAQEAAGEGHTGKTLGGYTPALPGPGKLCVTSVLQGPGLATWDIW